MKSFSLFSFRFLLFRSASSSSSFSSLEDWNSRSVRVCWIQILAMNGNEAVGDAKMEMCTEKLVYMWGYLPGASPEKAPILSPVPVRLSDPVLAGYSWKDVCGGGCGFAMAISGSPRSFTVVPLLCTKSDRIVILPRTDLDLFYDKQILKMVPDFRTDSFFILWFTGFAIYNLFLTLISLIFFSLVMAVMTKCSYGNFRCFFL